jgi:hypothetical protein
MAKERPPIKPASRAEFVAAMKKFAEEAGVELEMIEREQARLMLRDAMTFSPPMPVGGGQGLTKGAWTAGKRKLASDVQRIFIPQDSPTKGKSVFLRQVINAVKLGSGVNGGFGAEWLEVYTSQTASKVRSLSPIMQKIMNDTDHRRSFQKASNYLNKANIHGTYRPIAGVTSQPRPIHDQYKNAVNGRWKPGQPIGGPQYYIESTAALNAYIASRQTKVGWVKAGYADSLAKVPNTFDKNGSGRNYGAYDAPWVDANKAGYGTYAVTKSRGKVMSVIGNNIGNMGGVADSSDVRNIVYGNRLANLQVTLQRRADKLAARANRRGNK